MNKKHLSISTSFWGSWALLVLGEATIPLEAGAPAAWAER